ncbi:MAG: hypothetical protein SFV23_16245 [Planctomycetaceae bacterium]|nr:hypothetical protein [Planctomycetaceae bacterium]
MFARCQRFLLRVHGTQRLIFLGVLAYDIYLYYEMFLAGAWMFIALVVPTGIIAGTIAAGVLRGSHRTMENLIQWSAAAVMGIFLVSKCFKIVFPFWVYLIGHMLLWFWFTACFWYASRPFEFDLEFAEEGND